MSPLPPTEFGMQSIRRTVLGSLRPLGRPANPRYPSRIRCRQNPALRKREHAWKRGYSTGSSRACTPQYPHIYAWSTLIRPPGLGHVILSDLGSTCSHPLYALQAPNLQCFIDRVGAHPDRLQQVYFNTVLLLRAVSRLGPYLSAYDYCSTGTHEEDTQTKNLLGSIIDIAQQVGKFDEKLMFAGDDANVSQVSSVWITSPS